VGSRRQAPEDARKRTRRKPQFVVKIKLGKIVKIKIVKIKLGWFAPRARLFLADLLGEHGP
jgi:hypothetical protein